MGLRTKYQFLEMCYDCKKITYCHRQGVHGGQVKYYCRSCWTTPSTAMPFICNFHNLINRRDEE